MIKKVVSGMLVCMSLYGAVPLYILTNTKSELIAVSSNPFYASNDLKRSSFQLYVAPLYSSYLSENHGYKMVGCSKGLFSGEDPRCGSPFYSVNEAVFILPKKADVGEIIGSAIINTIVVPLQAVTLTAYVQKKFNHKAYNEFLDLYGIEVAKKDLLKDLEAKQGVVFRGCDLSLFEPDDVLALTPLLGCKRGANEGLFIYRSHDGVFSDDKGEALGLFSPQDLTEPLKVVQTVTQRSAERFMDINALYPMVPLPKVLPELVIEKSQFEKEVVFQERKAKIIQERDDLLKEINQNYIEAVKSRNLKIFDTLEERKKKIEKVVTTIRKSAFLAVGLPPVFSFGSYDAEKEDLYGSVTFGSKKYGVISKGIDPKLAQKMYESPKDVISMITYTGGNGVEGSSFEVKALELGFGSKKIPLSYTDTRYTPPLMRLVLPSYDLAAFKKEIASATSNASMIDSIALQALQDIEKYRVATRLSVNDQTIVRVNAKMPMWYESPSCGTQVCAVGRGETQQEALKVTLAQLGCVVKANVASTLDIAKTDKNGVATENNNYTIKQTCSNNFQDSDIEVTHTTEMDGWYYIRAVLNKI